MTEVMRESDDDRGELILTALRLESLRQTSMPVSAYMEKAFGYQGFRRYVAFTRTRSGFLYWTDGIEDGLSAVAVWDRFLNHPLIRPHLGDCRFN